MNTHSLIQMVSLAGQVADAHGYHAVADEADALLRWAQAQEGVRTAGLGDFARALGRGLGGLFEHVPFAKEFRNFWHGMPKEFNERRLWQDGTPQFPSLAAQQAHDLRQQVIEGTAGRQFATDPQNPAYHVRMTDTEGGFLGRGRPYDQRPLDPKTLLPENVKPAFGNMAEQINFDRQMNRNLGVFNALGVGGAGLAYKSQTDFNNRMRQYDTQRARSQNGLLETAYQEAQSGRSARPAQAEDRALDTAFQNYQNAYRQFTAGRASRSQLETAVRAFNTAYAAAQSLSEAGTPNRPALT